MKWTSGQKGILLTLLSVLSGSVTPVLNKFALLQATPAAASSWNAIFSLIISGLFLLAAAKGISRIPWRPLFFIGLCHGLGLLFMYTSLELLEPVTVSLLGRFYVLFAILMGVFVLKEKLKKSDAFIFLIVILGSFLFMSRGGSASTAGVAMALAYTFFFALENLLCKKLVHGTSVYNISFCVNLISLLVIAVMMFIKNDGDPHFYFDTIPSLSALALIATSSLASILAINLGLTGLRFIDFTKASSIRSLSPLSSVAISFAFFPVALSFWNWIGAGLTIGALAMGPQLQKFFSKVQ